MRLRELSIIQYQNISKTHIIHKLWISLNAFKKQLEYLATNNFIVLTMDEAINYMKRKKRIKNARPISLTFDNGYMDFYENALPILSRYRFPGMVLVSPDKVGQSVKIGESEVRYLDWEALKELTNSNITIGAFEDNAWDINKIPEDVVQKHIIEYKKILEDKLRIQVRYFGAKEGVPNPRIRHILKAEGYRAFLTECPTNQRPDLYSIGRIQVDDNDFNIFLTKISRIYLFFKDKRTWKYVREYSLDKVAHRISEAWDRIRGTVSHYLE